MAGVTRGQGESAAYQRVGLQRKSIGSLQVPSSSCRPEQDVKLLLCTTFDEGEECPQSQGRKEPSGERAKRYPTKSHRRWAAWLPFSQAVSEGHRLGERQEAVDTVRGRQGPAKSQQDVRDVSIRFAAPDQESRRDERFLCECGFHVHRWMVDELKGALGLGCRSGAPHGVLRTEPSAPCCVAADPELLIECRGQSVL